MDSLCRDVFRLDLISQMYAGQERFSAVTYFQDFVNYFFTKFTVNIKHVLKDFAGSEIQNLNHRHRGKIGELSAHSLDNIGKTIIPIPKGMIRSYHETLDRLLAVLDIVHSSTIEQDLNAILNALGTGRLKTITISGLDKETFELTKVEIGKLFGKTGLSHSTVSHALVSSGDVLNVNDTLMKTTATYYPIVLRLNDVLKKIETRFSQLKFNENDKNTLSTLLMIMAYRLSIMAVVINHIQELEHGFANSLDIVIKNV